MGMYAFGISLSTALFVYILLAQMKSDSTMVKTYAPPMLKMLGMTLLVIDWYIRSAGEMRVRMKVMVKRTMKKVEYHIRKYGMRTERSLMLPIYMSLYFVYRRREVGSFISSSSRSNRELHFISDQPSRNPTFLYFYTQQSCIYFTLRRLILSLVSSLLDVFSGDSSLQTRSIDHVEVVSCARE